MLREARLLDSLSHECIIPLERGWLEQRTSLEQPHICACAVCRSSPLKKLRGVASQDVYDTSATGKESTAADVMKEECLCLRQPHSWGATATATKDSGVCCGGCGRKGSPVRFSVESGYGLQSEDDAVAFLLRSWVPLTVRDVEADDGEYDAAEQDQGGEMAGSNKNIRESGSRSGSQYGGVDHLRWGGDGTTDWKGNAEPKSTANAATLKTTISATEKQFDMTLLDPIAATEGCCCLCARGGRDRGDDGIGNRIAFLCEERIVCLASYMLLPDWLPLSVWFETEFEPRTSAVDEEDRAATTGMVTAAHDWALVWRHLLSMFVQVRGVHLKKLFWRVEGLCLNFYDKPHAVCGGCHGVECKSSSWCFR